MLHVGGRGSKQGLERRVLPPSQKISHSRIQNLSQKISHLTQFEKCMCMQESISTKYG